VSLPIQDVPAEEFSQFPKQGTTASPAIAIDACCGHVRAADIRSLADNAKFSAVI